MQSPQPFLKELFKRLNGRILTSPHGTRMETWVLRKPRRVRFAGFAASTDDLRLARQIVQAFRAATAVLRYRYVSRSPADVNARAAIPARLSRRLFPFAGR